MHTVVVWLSADPARRTEVVRHLREDVLPWARSRPGFVSGQWLLSADGHRGGGVMVFESAEAAEQAVQGPRGSPRDDARAWNIDHVEIYEQVAELA